MVLAALLKKLPLRARLFYCLLLGAQVSVYGASAPPNDAFMEGYAQAVMETHYGPCHHKISVREGVLYFTVVPHSKTHPAIATEKLLSALKQIRGVTQVVVLSSVSKTPKGPMITEKHEPQRSKVIYGDVKLALPPVVPAAAALPVMQSEFSDGFMVSPSIFKPLIADPRWPRFSLAYHNLLDSPLATHAFSPNFGATLPFYRVTLKNGSQLEAGVQAGLFAIMDIGHSPSALINADYVGGGFAALVQGPWSHMLRLSHLSSHLGDEFMLTPEGKRTKRVNLSYETLSYLFSHEQDNGLRFYGGGGYKVHVDPSYVKRTYLQGGGEYRHAHAYWNNQLRPVAGLDITVTQQAAWRPDASLKVGVQLENSTLHKHVTQLMLEFYQGRSIYGQFYSQPLRYIGIGLHVFL